MISPECQRGKHHLCSGEYTHGLGQGRCRCECHEDSVAAVFRAMSYPAGRMVAVGRVNDPPPAPARLHRKEALPIMQAAATDSFPDPLVRARLALSILNQRPATENTLELAVMALRGADIDDLLAADQQMAGR